VDVEFDDGTTQLAAADDQNNRAVVVVAECIVSCSGTNDHATFEVGWPADSDAVLSAAQMEAAGVGDILIGAGMLPATAVLSATVTDGGTPDQDDGGEFLFTVLIMPQLQLN
jgi:hypothetical protein